jgi:dihydrofolate reductase
VASIDAALEVATDADEVMVIGGSQLYAEFLPRADRIYLTRVQVEVEGDAHLPELNSDEWQETSVEEHCADESNDHDVTFSIMERA